MIINDKNFLIFIFCLTLILVFAFSWQPGYLDDDSIMYARVAKEVAISNQWLCFNDPSYGGPFYYHFPLLIWVSAIAFKIFGENVISASIFSLVSCLGAVIAIFYFGKLIKNSWVGVFASAVFLLINFTLRLAVQCRMDMPVTLFIILSLYFFLKGLEIERINYLLFGLFTGIAIMTKDVNGLAPLPIAFIYLVITKKFKEIINPYFLLAIVLAFLPVITWILLETHFYGYSNTIFNKWLHWNFLHLLSSKHFKAPFYYYPREIIKRFPYFAPFFVYGAYLAIRKVFKKESNNSLLVVVWFIFIPLAFSFGRQKIHYFIYSMYPAAALLSGIAIDNLCNEEKKEKIFKILIILLVLFGLFRLCFPVRYGKRFFTDIVAIAPIVDSILAKAEDFEFITYNQDDSALVFYSKQLENTQRIKDFDSLKFKLQQESQNKKRFCFLNSSDFENLEAAIKVRWHVLLKFDDKILIADKLQENLPIEISKKQ
ncbi:MAG: glycosyltransferase family 39 protein [Candidatus Omnitrophota bacterium]